MSEVSYRQRLRGFRSPSDYDLGLFASALLESILPIPEQLQRILMLDNAHIAGYAIKVSNWLQLKLPIPDLIQVYEATQDWSLRHCILEVLSHQEGEQIDQFLVSIMQSPGDSHLRGFAAFVLRRGRRPDIGEALLAAARNTEEDDQLRCMAIEALGDPGRRSYLPQILPLFQDTEASVRFAVLRVVGFAGDASLASYIEPLLTDTTPVVGSRTIADIARDVLQTWGLTPSD